MELDTIERLLWCLLIVVTISMIGFMIYAFLYVSPITIVETDIPAKCIGRRC